jgi:P4 family phage/plasmid primase-like protien
MTIDTHSVNQKPHSPINVKEYYNHLTSVDIATISRELLSGRITVENGSHIACNCPHHDSVSRQSLHITPSKQAWFCFGCSIGGDVLQLIEFVQSGTVTKGINGSMPESHRQARDWLAAKIGLPPLQSLGSSPEEWQKVEQKRVQEERVFSCLTTFADYLHQRLRHDPAAYAELHAQYQLSDEIVKSQKIGFGRFDAYTIPSENGGEPVQYPSLMEFMSERGFSEVDMNEASLLWESPIDAKLRPGYGRNRFVVPYWDRGRVVYLIGRRTKWSDDSKFEQKKYHKLECYDEKKRKWVAQCIKNVLHNEDALATDPPQIIIAEGITDNLALMDRGFASISPVTTRLTRADLRRIVKRLKGKTVYIANDNEVSKAGEAGARSTAEYLEGEGVDVRLITLPLNPDQEAARSLIQERWGIHEHMSAKEVSDARLNIPKEEISDYEALCAQSKQDVNSFFRNFTAKDFQTLIDSTPPRIDSVMQSLIAGIPLDGTTEKKDAAVEEILKTCVKGGLLPIKTERYLRDIKDKTSGEYSIKALSATLKQIRKGTPGISTEAGEFRPDAVVDEILRRFHIIFWGGRFFKYGEGYYQPIDDWEIKDIIRGLGDGGFLKHHIEDAIHTLRIRTFVRDELMNPPGLLNAQNGMLNVMEPDPDLFQHSPEIYSTVRVPFDINENAECPQFQAFLNRALPDRDVRNLVQEIFGYLLSPDNSMQLGFFFLGRAATGKSTLTNILRSIAGPANCSSIPLEKLGDRFNVAGIHNKLINISGEVARKAVLDDQVVKAVTGGDTLQGERKNQQPFDFKPYCRLVIACNSLPRSLDSSSAFFRRWIVVMFDQQIPQSEWIRNFDQQLVEAEGAGILAWALSGLARLKERGQFIVPQSCLDAVGEWREMSDPIIRFMNEYMREIGSGHVLVRSIMDQYNQWIEATTGMGKYHTTISFRKRLEDLGVEVTRAAGSIAVRGYRLLPFPGPRNGYERNAGWMDDQS